ncbi:30609_t:CDS:1, partial [Racocetra persica]
LESSQKQIKEICVNSVIRLEKKIKEKDKIIEEQTKKLNYHADFFGPSFAVAEMYYKYQKEYENIFEIVNNFTDEVYLLNSLDNSLNIFNTNLIKYDEKP